MIINNNLGINILEDMSFELVKNGARLAKGHLSIWSGRKDLLRDIVKLEGISAPQLIEGPFGEGNYWVIQGTIQNSKYHIQIMMNVYVYPQWSDAFILKWKILNIGETPFEFDKWDCPGVSIDDWLDNNESGDMPWSMQAAAVNWGQDFAFPLPEVFKRQNYLGHLDSAEGGGVPIVYFWNFRYGLALSHIEPIPKDWYIPVTYIKKNHKTLAAFQEKQRHILTRGQSLDSLTIMISLHQGDFFAPLALYREVLSVQGVKPAEPNIEDFEPAWCSWGYEFDVHPEEMTGILPMLNELGIRWLTLDDRWFDRYGDWKPRPDTFPGGEVQMRQIVGEIHHAGAKAQLWWYPLAVEDGTHGWHSHAYNQAEIFQQHPEWVCLNQDGSVARNNRNLAIMCPAVPEVQQYIFNLIHRFIEDWDFDGHKLDNIYTIPACYNPTHRHIQPDESIAALAKVYNIIYSTTKALKPDSVIQICPCGTPPTFSLLPFMDQAVTADPTSSAQIRQRIKFYKALLGPHVAVFADHVELSDSGIDFASEIGPGGVPSSKFIWPPDPEVDKRVEEVWNLTPEKKAIWKSWLDIYRKYQLSQGEYLNLYDLAFYQPEAHAIRINDRLYYAFYSGNLDQEYHGIITLRGLDSQSYLLYDYVHGQEFKHIQGPEANVEVLFKGYLLLEASPEK
jgi:alpha-galactosidase